MTEAVDRLRHESDIRRLLAEYCHHYDDGRPDAYAALFTADATFTVFGRTRRGRDDIRASIGTRAPDAAPGQHVTYNSVIDVAADGRSGTARTDFLYLRLDEAGPVISTAGRYHDELVREPDRWRFQSRTITFLGERPRDPSG